MTTWLAWTGSGKRWTGRSPRRRSVGGKTGPSPVDRGKRGAKRSLLVDGAGIPLGLAIDGANRPDFQLVEGTLLSIPIPRPEPTPAQPQHLCLDKGYDVDEVYGLLFEFGYTPHIRARGEDARAVQREAGKRARRWVVERTHSWLNRFRRLLVRWEKTWQSYLGFLHLACAIITFRATQRAQAKLLG